jgi:hypothetical protein
MYQDIQDREADNQELGHELEKSKGTVTELRKSLNYQIDLQSHLNQTILRIVDGNFNKDDLMIVCKFSLFREDENKLILDASHGLTRTPDVLHLDNLSVRQVDWAVVRA